MTIVEHIVANLFDIGGGGFKYKSPPVVVLKEEPGVGLLVILHTEFDENGVGDRNASNQVLSDAVFTPLRKKP
jgi:hypothetical protein